MNVQRNPSRRCLWKINVQNGVPTLADPWYQYLANNDLMPGDEVVFYYTFKKHGWDVLYRKLFCYYYNGTFFRLTNKLIILIVELLYYSCYCYFLYSSIDNRYDI